MTRIRSRIWRACATAAIAAAVALGAAGSAHAGTKWLCGPGVAGDPVPAAAQAPRSTGAGTCRSGTSLHGRARDRGVACFYVYPTVSNQPGRLATKRIDPELRSIALYQTARFSQLCQVYAPVYRQATVPALQAGKTTRSRLPHGLRRRGTGLRRVPPAHRPAPGLRPPRPLAGQLPPQAARPAADRRPSRPATPARVRRAPRRRRHHAQGLRTGAARSATSPPASGRPSSTA